MKKEVPCLDCRGQGLISKFNEKSAWSERCPNCGGTGVITVVVTNADRIRAMSDEELAEYLCGLTYCCECKHRDTCNGDDGYLKWLQHPAKEDA